MDVLVTWDTLPGASKATEGVLSSSISFVAYVRLLQPNVGHSVTTRMNS